MIKFKDYFFYTTLLSPGVLVKHDGMIFQGVTLEEYKKIGVTSKKKGA